MMTDLTPETLTEWREEAGVGVCSDPRREFGRDHRIVALLDALAAEKAHAVKAEQERVPFVRGYRLHDDGSMSSIERWVKRADGQWVSLDSGRATYSDIQMVVD